MSSYRSAVERYRKHRAVTKELLEEEALHNFRMRVDVVSIDDDILRRVRRDWYGNPSRRVDWDWDAGIIQPLRRTNARAFDIAMLVKGQLCGLAAARVSHKKRWLSLTHIEGAPCDHALKGVILPLVVNALYIYRGVICTEEAVKDLGIRILNPLDEALTCYKANGYTVSTDSKRLRSIVIEPSIASDYGGEVHGIQAQDDSESTTEDGTDGNGDPRSGARTSSC